MPERGMKNREVRMGRIHAIKEMPPSTRTDRPVPRGGKRDILRAMSWWHATVKT